MIEYLHGPRWIRKEDKISHDHIYTLGCIVTEGSDHLDGSIATSYSYCHWSRIRSKVDAVGYSLWKAISWAIYLILSRQVWTDICSVGKYKYSFCWRRESVNMRKKETQQNDWGLCCDQ